MSKRIKTRSGLAGWQRKLRRIYGSFKSFLNWDETYGLSKKLGYATPKSAWKHNPTVQGSVHPRDYCKVYKNGKRVYPKEL